MQALKYDPDSPTTQDGGALAEGEAAEDPFKDVPVLSKTPAELYLFDTESDMFTIQEKEVQVEVASNGDFESEPDPGRSTQEADCSLDHRPKQCYAIHLHPHRR